MDNNTFTTQDWAKVLASFNFAQTHSLICPKPVSSRSVPYIDTTNPPDIPPIDVPQEDDNTSKRCSAEGIKVVQKLSPKELEFVCDKIHQKLIQGYRYDKKLYAACPELYSEDGNAIVAKYISEESTKCNTRYRLYIKGNSENSFTTIDKFVEEIRRIILREAGTTQKDDEDERKRKRSYNPLMMPPFGIDVLINAYEAGEKDVYSSALEAVTSEYAQYNEQHYKRLQTYPKIMHELLMYACK